MTNRPAPHSAFRWPAFREPIVARSKRRAFSLSPRGEGRFGWTPIVARSRRKAFSLLEVILALAILGVSLAVLGELARWGLRHAGYTRDLTQAQLLCESKISEIVAGLVSPEPVVDVLFASEDLVDPNDPVGWVYSIELADTDQPGLVAVAVTVSQNLPPERKPVRCTLVRWIPDPGIEAYDIGAEAANEALQSQSSGSASQTESSGKDTQ